MGGVLRLRRKLGGRNQRHSLHSLIRNMSNMSKSVWIVEWHRYTGDDGGEKWSSMTFNSEKKATLFANLVGAAESDAVVLLQGFDTDEDTLIVRTLPRHATIFALVTWADDSKTIHWNLPNDVLALWMALDKFGDPDDAIRIQVCEREKDSELDLNNIEESLIDFTFESGEEDDEL